MFEGIFCPSITITDAAGAIDYELWGRHLDHLAEAGLDGVLLFGSIGEFYAFPSEVKKEALAFAVERVAGRMKVLLGVGDTAMDRVLDLTAFAERAGADGVVAVSPYYFGPSAPCAEEYFGAIAGALSEIDRRAPFVLSLALYALCLLLVLASRALREQDRALAAAAADTAPR